MSVLRREIGVVPYESGHTPPYIPLPADPPPYEYETHVCLSGVR